MVSAVADMRCRQIDEADIEAVASLLARGFPARHRQFWLGAFAQLTRHAQPAGLPKYGYLLESRGAVVGAYAPLLVSQALRHKDVTYLNVSSAPHTRPIIEAQGFARYADGIFVAMPMLQGLFGGPKVAVLPAEREPTAAYDPFERDVMLEHVAHGCIGLWCVTAERAYPFVFRPRLVRRIFPCAQLIYCRDVADFVRFAGPIARHVARFGKPFIVLDANGYLPGLFGFFSRGKMPKYFKGPQRPRLGDLAYTENAVLGV
jgi:hypothetical protein